MSRDEALAEIEAMFKLPPTRHRVWDSLQPAERAAIVGLAGYGRTDPLVAANMPPEMFDRCWMQVERMARLALRVAAANDRQPEQDEARLMVLCQATRGAA